jgi:hypothetical protein
MAATQSSEIAHATNSQMGSTATNPPVRQICKPTGNMSAKQTRGVTSITNAILSE